MHVLFAAKKSRHVKFKSDETEIGRSGVGLGQLGRSSGQEPPEDGGEARKKKCQMCCRVVNFHLLQFNFSFGALPLLMMNLPR